MSDRSGGNGGNLTGGKLLDQATLEQHTRQSNLVLASASPRRAELMAGMGLDFRVSPAGINEDPLPGEPAEELVQRLAWAKAWSVAMGLTQGLVVGADSLVVFGGEVFGKPDGPTQAWEMLRRLRGVRHRVVTGVAVIDVAGGSGARGVHVQQHYPAGPVRRRNSPLD